MPDHALRALIARFDALVQRGAKDCPADCPQVGWTVDFIRECLELPIAQHALWDAQAGYYRARRTFRAWFLNPAAWTARAQRNRRRSELLSKTRKFNQGYATLEGVFVRDRNGFEATVNRYLLSRLRHLR